MNVIIIRFLVILILSAVSNFDSFAVSDSLLGRKGQFEDWRVIHQKESGIIGGKIKEIYKLQKGCDLHDYRNFKQKEEDIFAPCNITANVLGIVKGSNSVMPEPRGDGYCAKLEVVLEEVKVIGLIDIEALAQGSIITGTFHEPVRDTKNPYAKISSGIPFTYRPKALRFDYKTEIGNPIIRATGLSPRKQLPGEDYPYIEVLLQKRVEDEKGNVRAYRVGTGIKVFNENEAEWVNGDILEIRYGDISEEEDFNPVSDLKSGYTTHYCINGKGKNVPMEEVGWADAGTEPTHLIIWISSSMGKAFYGALGNKLWIDNVEFLY